MALNFVSPGRLMSQDNSSERYPDGLNEELSLSNVRTERLPVRACILIGSRTVIKSSFYRSVGGRALRNSPLEICCPTRLGRAFVCTRKALCTSTRARIARCSSANHNHVGLSSAWLPRRSSIATMKPPQRCLPSRCFFRTAAGHECVRDDSMESSDLWKGIIGDKRFSCDENLLSPEWLMIFIECIYYRIGLWVLYYFNNK